MLLEQIDSNLKQAMRDKNEVATSALRNLKAAFKNTEIEKQRVLSDQEALSVIAKKVKQHKDSIAEFEKGGRADLVAIEQSQMAVLEKYLPKQMDEEVVRSLVASVIKDLNATASDFGKVMKEVVSRVKGQADGALISKVVKEELK